MSSQYGRNPKTSRRSPLGPIGAAAAVPPLLASAVDPDVEAGSTVASRGTIGRSTVSSSPTWSGASVRSGAPAAQIEPSPASCICRPVALPMGRARGALPSTSHVSSLRGLNGTVTRSPGSNAITSFACSWAWSQWTDGRFAVTPGSPPLSPPVSFSSARRTPAVRSGSTLAGRADTGDAVAATSSARPSARRSRAGRRAESRSGLTGSRTLRPPCVLAQPYESPLEGSTGYSGVVRCDPVQSGARWRYRMTSNASTVAIPPDAPTLTSLIVCEP